MALTLWERFTHWAVKDFYTLEERALMLAEAERLNLKTKLQRERIEKREAQQKEARESFRTVAVWKLPCKVNGVNCYQHFYLQQTKDPVDKDKYYRRVAGGPIIQISSGKALSSQSQIGPFERGQSAYIQYILPWHEWTIPTKDLKVCKDITVLK